MGMHVNKEIIIAVTERQSLIELTEQELLPYIQAESLSPTDPVCVQYVPEPWKLIGCGNYAVVVYHPRYPESVVKMYVKGRPGIENETEVYRKLGVHPAFASMVHAGGTYLILTRLYGHTLNRCLMEGIPIPEQVIRDIDEALAYARRQGLFPRDIHGKNVLNHNGRGFVADVSDFLLPGKDPMWDDLRRSYYLVYKPFLLKHPVRIPKGLLEGVRKLYQRLDRKKAYASLKDNYRTGK